MDKVSLLSVEVARDTWGVGGEGRKRSWEGVLGGENPPISLPQSGLGRMRSSVSGVRGSLE